MNDLLVTALFAALHDWFGEYSPASYGRVCRVMVPMNLRTEADEETPAANLVCMINLDRRMKRRTAPQKLLKFLSIEMGIVKRFRLGLTFHHILGLARRLGSLDRLLPTDRCLSTCVLSNLGEPLPAANAPLQWGAGSPHGVELETIEPLPPLRPYTAAAFGVISYAGQTAISLHSDPSLRADKAERLLRLFVGRLENDFAAH